MVPKLQISFVTEINEVLSHFPQDSYLTAVSRLIFKEPELLHLESLKPYYTFVQIFEQVHFYTPPHNSGGVLWPDHSGGVL